MAKKRVAARKKSSKRGSALSPASELFYYEDGKRADAALHEPILADGDEATALEPVISWAQANGYTAAEIKLLWGVDVDLTKYDPAPNLHARKPQSARRRRR